MNSNQQPPEAPFAIVVNDDPVQLALLSALVRKANLQPLSFTSAEAALTEMMALHQKAEKRPGSLPALVFTDLYMPGIDGWNFCRLLRSPQYAPLNRIPILVVSATFAGDETARIAADLGAEGFISAPVDGRLFAERVKAIMEGKNLLSLPRALIVEENKALADTLKTAFAAHGFRADAVFTPGEALAAFTETTYDVAVIAYHLPHGSGDTLLDALRRKRSDCVFIMITGDPNPELAAEWMRRGASASLRKPFAPEYLIDLCCRARRERVLLRVQDLLEKRTHQLRESEEKYRMIFEHSPLGLLYLDSRGTIASCNDSFVRIVGSAREALLGLNTLNLPDKGLVAVIKDALEGKSGAYEGLYQSVTASKMTEGRAIFASVTDQDGFGRGVVGIIEDTTERNRVEEEKGKLEAQLQQAQKMESVGRLAGGVAHDFNNMLGVIIGHADMAMHQAEPVGRLFAHLREIKKAAERSAALTRQLLAFARKQTISPRVVDLNDSLEGMLKMLRRLIGEDIDLVWLPGSALWPVKLDPSQLDQVLANLCVNARDAIVGTGKVTIETGNVTCDSNCCAFQRDFVPGDYVLLSVTDDGCGMDRDLLEKVFEPFFTTKEQGKGTGLGLATVYGIVKQNGGFLNVLSEPDLGTTFKIYLPRYKGKVEPLREDDLSEPASRGNETILLVEDEPANLEMGKTMLEELGYRVLPAATPAESLRLAEKYVGEIHLLVTDVIMPEMNGRDLAKNLLALYPNLRRLFMSGYTADVIARSGILDPGIHFIQKPFSLKEISVKIREALADFEN